MMGKLFICPRCGNSDPRYIGYKNGMPYCRACIGFQGRKADIGFCVNRNVSLELKYPLSEKQKEISDSVVYALSCRKNVLIHAVTGAGKTELVYRAMEETLKKGGQSMENTIRNWKETSSRLPPISFIDMNHFLIF